MRIQVVVTDDQGRVFEGDVVLTPRPSKSPSRKGRTASTSREAKPVSVHQSDFALSARAFVRRYGARNLSGAQKFVLLLSWIAKGRTTSTVDIGQVRRDWARMTEPMGGTFNPAYPTRAGDRGWVEIPKKGTYRLRPTWTEILSR